MAAILETNIYSPSISKVDPNNDVANQQLANRTLYLKTTVDSLQKFLNTYKVEHSQEFNALTTQVNALANTLKNLESSSGNINEKGITDKLAEINKTLDELKEELKNHKHLYAGSKRAGGDANSVEVLEDNISEFNIIGSTDLLPSKLRKSTKITVENDTIKAGYFDGVLKGVSDSAMKLYNTPRITLSGDIVGSAVFDGDKDLVINTNLKDQSVAPGEYGTTGNYTLGSEGSFTVPSITVNSLGIITKIRNRTITLPKNLGVNGITSSLPTQKKIYVIGTSEQAERSATYSQTKVFIKDDHIYSNGNEAVNISDMQTLRNKIYEGYVLGDACARGVDSTIGGTPDDSRLVTSNALYRHKHRYALSDSIDGKSLYSVITDDNVNKGYVITNNNPNGSLNRNTNVYLQGNGLFGKDLTAIDNMYIPGGKIWIDSVAVPIEDDSWKGNADIKEDLTDVQKKTREVVVAKELQGNNGVIHVYAGMLLAYKKNGYVLASNNNIELCDNVVLTATDATAQTVRVMDHGKYDLESEEHDGDNCYIGEDGRLIFAPTKTVGRINKKVGYVEGSFLIFNPSSYALLVK